MVISVCAVGPALGQEALRLSLANLERAEARRQAAAGFGHYNVRLGTATWAFSAGLRLGYTDNVRAYGRGEGGDAFFEPHAGARLRWPITDRNTLDANFSGGYRLHVEHSNLDRLFISPSSELNFGMTVGDVVLNFHERPSIIENAYADPTLSGREDVTRFQNSVGLEAAWDLNRVLLRLGYDHNNYVSLGSSTRYPDGQVEVFSASVGYAPKPARLYGLELGLGLIDFSYSGMGTNLLNVIADGTQMNAGLFYADQLTDHIALRVHAGYTTLEMSASPLVAGGTDSGSVYFSATLTHQVNERIRHSLSAGRMVNLAFYGGHYEIDSIRWEVDWRILHKITLGTPFYYERWSQLGRTGGAADRFDRYGAGLSLARHLSEKLGAALRYDFIWKDSRIAGASYTANTFTLSFSYQF